MERRISVGNCFPECCDFDDPCCYSAATSGVINDGIVPYAVLMRVLDASNTDGGANPCCDPGWSGDYWLINNVDGSGCLTLSWTFDGSPDSVCGNPRIANLLLGTGGSFGTNVGISTEFASGAAGDGDLNTGFSAPTSWNNIKNLPIPLSIFCEGDNPTATIIDEIWCWEVDPDAPPEGEYIPP